MMAPESKLLITGSEGQLGADLVKFFSRDYKVCGVDIMQMDIRDFRMVGTVFQKCEPEIVLHAAAYTDVDGAETDRDRAFAVNAEGTANIARACKEYGARMIYFSTDYVFDGDKKTPYVESDPPSPQTVYGKSKYEGEKRVAEILEDFTIIRLAWLYGASGKNFIRTLIRQAWQQMRMKEAGQIITPVTVVNDQTGNPTWTMDTVKQTKIIIDNDLNGIIHATAEGETSWFDLAKEVFDFLKMPVYLIPCSSEAFASPAPRPKYSSLENRVLNNAGWNVMRPYKEALHDFLSHHRE